MSKKNQTKNLILDHALKLFNEHGIEYVGVRDIANDLGLRVGNVTYYYPTKNDIIEEITARLVELNAKTIVPVIGLTIRGFLEMYAQVFENQYVYRCLFINFIHHLEQNKEFEKNYIIRQNKRFEILRKNIAELVTTKYIKQKTTPEQRENILSNISLISRFWLSEARVKFKDAPKKKMIRHYMTLMAHNLYPYCTAKGRKEINDFTAGF